MLRIGSLCSGVAGLDLAVLEVFGGSVAWHAEIDPAASAVLARHSPAAPNHGDLTAADWSTVEPVDVVTAGWPCQPWSSAGKRKGAADERAIWPAVAGAVRDLRPGLVVLENVSRIVAAGELARAVGDLAGFGYVGSWCCLRASDVGAPHRRERAFVVASHADGGTRRAQPLALAERSHPAVAGQGPGPVANATSNGWGEGWPESAGQFRRLDVAVSGGATTADPASEGRGRCQPQPISGYSGSQVRAGEAEPGRCGRAAADTDGAGRVGPGLSGAELRGEAGPAARRDDLQHGAAADSDGARQPQPPRAGDGIRGRAGDSDQAPEWGPYEPAVRRWERIIGRPAPTPTVAGKRGARQLSPWLVEWMMGFPHGWVCDTPGLSRNDHLRLLGNGVVPQQGVEGIRRLILAADGGAA